MDCRTLIAHPKLPILHVLTADGRVLVIAISVKVKGQLISKCLFGVSNSPKEQTFSSLFGRIETNKMSFPN